MFVADITDEFILRLHILQACDASVDVGHRVLRMGLDEVPVRKAPAASVFALYVIPRDHLNAFL
jgi:hypothetical protein